MILWCWDELDGIWEACELPVDAAWRLGPDASVIALSAGRAMLLARSGVWVNGLPSLPACSLEHLDEFRAGGRTFVFSAESRHEPGPLPARTDGAACARCKATLRGGESVIVCGGCGSPHHPECFAFDPLCAACPFPTTGILTIPGSVS